MTHEASLALFEQTWIDPAAGFGFSAVQSRRTFVHGADHAGKDLAAGILDSGVVRTPTDGQEVSRRYGTETMVQKVIALITV